MAEGEMDSHPRVLRRLENIVAERRLASFAASSALFYSGASPKTVINCLWPRSSLFFTDFRRFFHFTFHNLHYVKNLFIFLLEK
jgi:hypothetical protein